MKTKFFTTAFAMITALLMMACSSEAQNKKQPETSNAVATVEVIQFHSENRCMTCNKIEALTKETLKSYPQIPFKLVNVDDKKNEKLAEQFEASGTALFLFNNKTGNKKDLTEFAFMTVHDKDKFMKELKKHIDGFLKP